MNTDYKIAVVGDKDSVTAFKALGVTAVPCESAIEAKHALKALKNGADRYAIIYITEQLAEELTEEVAAYRNNADTALIPIPSKSGSTGFAMASLSSAAERATGTKLF